MSSLLNILYIGSNPECFNSTLQKDDFSLTTVANSLSAVNYLSGNNQPDVIICEYNLPGQNGLFLFDWVREHPMFNGTAFILLTESFSTELYKTAFIKRVDDFYVMPDTNPEDVITRAKLLHEYKKNSTAQAPVKSTTEIYRIPLSKRIFDIVVASSVLLVASPFLLLIIIAIRLESKGKVYYTAKRVGRKTFDFYKLRSMRTGSDELLKKLAKEKNQYNTNAVQQNDEVDMPPLQQIT
jgi:CheY-like chemotaxis protein